MGELVKRIPVPFCGVMLAVASLGTLFEPYARPAHVVCGIVAFCMLALVLAKIIAHPRLVAADLGKPVLAGVAGTFPMALLSLSTYLLPVSRQVALVVWALGIVVYLGLIANFLVRFARAQDKLPFLTPASFVILIGLVLADLTGTAYGAETFCLVLFWIELAVTVADLVAVTVRYARHPVRDASMRPLLCIYTAPPSMCLACLLQVVPSAPGAVVVTWYAVACAFYLFALVTMLRCLRQEFTPSFASMTFPFVISTTATFKVAAFFAGGAGAFWLSAVGFVQLGIATCIVVYVLARLCVLLARP